MCASDRSYWRSWSIRLPLQRLVLCRADAKWGWLKLDKEKQSLLICKLPALRWQVLVIFGATNWSSATKKCVGWANLSERSSSSSSSFVAAARRHLVPGHWGERKKGRKEKEYAASRQIEIVNATPVGWLRRMTLLVVPLKQPLLSCISSVCVGRLWAIKSAYTCTY